jgi:hypothetical protein
LAAEETFWIVPISNTACKVSRPQPGKVILTPIGIVHEEWEICVFEFAALLETGDKVSRALVQLLRGLVYRLVVDVEPVRDIEFEDDAVHVIVQIDKIPAHLAGLAAQRLGDGLIGNGANHSSYSFYALRRVLPVVVNGSQNLGTVLGTGNRQRLGSDTVDRSFENSKVVVSKQVVVTSRFAIIGEGFDISEDIKDACRRVGTVVEQEHDPNIDCTQDSELGRHDDGRLLIRIVVCKVTHCCKQLICLVCREDEVSTPDLLKVSG